MISLIPHLSKLIGLGLILALANVTCAQPPNVLLITSDDLGLNLGCYGDPTVPTPNLDRLASDGVRFETAWVAQASCSSSRSAMFTGLYPHTNGQIDLARSSTSSKGGFFEVEPRYRDQFLPNLLHQAGYRTGIIGKLHVNPEAAFLFDQRPRLPGSNRDPRNHAKVAREFLEQTDDQPFFLMVNYTDPHVDGQRREGRQTFPPQVGGLPQNPLTSADVKPWPTQGIDEPEQLTKIANFYNCVQRVDIGVGLLLDLLEEQGLRENTLIIFLGDHGPPFARGKTTNYQFGLAVPFLVDWPGVSEKGLVSPALVSAVDILPTVLDACDLPFPETLQGRSLRPVVQANDNASTWRPYLFAEHHYHGNFYPRRTVRDQRYHLIHNLIAGTKQAPVGIDGDKAYRFSQKPKYAGTATRRAFETFAFPPEFELYDLQSDPHELTNRIDDPSLADVRDRLTEALHDWRVQTDDPFLNPDRLNP